MKHNNTGVILRETLEPRPLVQAYFKTKQVERYGIEAVEYFKASKLLDKYAARKAIGSTNTGQVYRSKLNVFLFFVYSKVDSKHSFDSTMDKVKSGKINSLDLLADFASFMKQKGIRDNEIRIKTKMARRFLRFCGVSINLEDFHDQVSLPRTQHNDLKALTKTEVIELLNNCKSTRLKTYLMLLAGTGARKTEACSFRNCDIDLVKGTVRFRAEFTKTRRERTRPITQELVNQIQFWQKVKYEPHRTVSGGVARNVTPEAQPEDLLFANWHGKKSNVAGVKFALSLEWRSLTKMLNVKTRDNGRREITFHRFRAFVKSTISDLGYSDFSEWMIGHEGSTYYRKSESELMALFKKIEPYFTFLDTSAMEASQRDLQTKVAFLERQLTLEKEQTKAIAERAALDVFKKITGHSEFPPLKGNIKSAEPEGA